jgi:hypothetical protein
MPDSRKNFSVSTVAKAPEPPTTGLSLEVTAGEGVRFPTPPFNAVVAPEKEIATPENAEVIRVTAISVNKFTIVRKQESSVAQPIAAGFRIYSGQTDKVLKDIEAGLVGPAGPTGATGPPGTELALGVAVTTTPRVVKKTDAGKSLDVNSAVTVTIKVEPFGVEGIPEGSVFEILKLGTGKVKIEFVSPATAIPVAATYELRETGSIAGLRKIDGANKWAISGDYV